MKIMGGVLDSRSRGLGSIRGGLVKVIMLCSLATHSHWGTGTE